MHVSSMVSLITKLRIVRAVVVLGGKVQGSAQRTNLLYALHARKEVEKTVDVINDLLKVKFDVYAFLDPCANLSFVTPFLANKFSVCPEVLQEPFEVYTPMGELVVARRVYSSFPMFILHKVVPCDLVDLTMVNVDFILRMNWLYTSIYYRTCKVKFQLHNEPILW